MFNIPDFGNYFEVGQDGMSHHLSIFNFSFEPACFYALGSPIAMFLAVRGIDSLGTDFKLPTCER